MECFSVLFCWLCVVCMTNPILPLLLSDLVATFCYTSPSSHLTRALPNLARTVGGLGFLDANRQVFRIGFRLSKRTLTFLRIAFRFSVSLQVSPRKTHLSFCLSRQTKKTKKCKKQTHLTLLCFWRNPILFFGSVTAFRLFLDLNNRFKNSRKF